VRFVFDTSVLIGYLRDSTDIAADALFLATERGEAFVSLISLMELYLPQNKSDWEIAREIKAIRELCQRLGIPIIPASGTSQRRALEVLKRHRSLLGKNALSDSIILSIGAARRAYLVTRDSKWFHIMPGKVLSPEDLLRRFR